MKLEISMLRAIVALALLQCAPCYATALDQKEAEPWLPSWHVQTSPNGDILNRFNLAVSRFFSPNIAIGIKGTKMSDASQSVFGKDDGYEAGARGSYYFFSSPSGRVRIGPALGLYYANFRRGNSLGDAIDSFFQSSTLDRDEINGLMVEGLASFLFAANSWLTFEPMAGLQAYKTSYYRYDIHSRAQFEREPASWKPHLVLELNIGVAF